MNLKETDPRIAELIAKEEQRQASTLELSLPEQIGIVSCHVIRRGLGSQAGQATTGTLVDLIAGWKTDTQIRTANGSAKLVPAA